MEGKTEIVLKEGVPPLQAGVQNIDQR